MTAGPSHPSIPTAGSPVPAVSVVMPVYNAAATVAAVVRGLLSQTFTNFELIVVDDGSTDDSYAILNEFAAADARVRLIRRANRGVVETRNELLARAVAPYMAVNDADDVSMPRRLEAQVAYLDAHPQCLALGGRMLFVTAGGLVVGEHFTLRSHEEIDAQNLSGGGSGIGHSASMIRTDAARAAGGYRAEYAPAEDLDLWLRLAENGRLANLGEILVHYRLGEASFGHHRPSFMEGRTRAAVRAARLRRGLPVGPDADTPDADTPDAVRSPVPGWINLALVNGNYATARKLAGSLVRRSPLSWRPWRMWLRALAGRAIDRARGRRPAPPRPAPHRPGESR